MCHLTSRDRAFKGLYEWLYEWKPEMVNHHLAMFGYHCSITSRDITYSICHVTSWDHVFEVSCDNMGGSSSWYVTTLPNLVAIEIAVVEICFWFAMWSYKTTWLKSYVALLVGAPTISHLPAIYGGHRHSVSWVIMVLVCHMVSQDHMIKESCHFMSRSPSRKITILPRLVATGSMVGEV